MKIALAKKAIAERGFTIVEILTVLGIIASLTAVIIVSSSSARANSRDKAREVDLGQIQLAIRLYREQNGTSPSSGTICASVATCGSGNTINGAVQTFIGTIEDPLHDGTNYFYSYDGTNVCAEQLERTPGVQYCVTAP